MEKRVLGKTGIEVSRLCYGTLSLSVYHANIHPEKGSDLLARAYKQGITFFDTAELYETYGHIKLALKKLDSPQNIIISSRSYANSYDEMMRSIERCLEETGKSQIEIFGMHEVQVDDFRPEALRALIEAKKQGLIKAVSITTHSAKVTDRASEMEEIEVIMPLINYKGVGIKDGDLTDMEKVIIKAKENGKGVYAMKVLAGGYFASDIRTSLDYVLDNKNIDSIAIGMDCEDEISFNSGYFNGKDVKNLEKNLKTGKREIYVEPWCVGCESCIKVCPQNAIILEFSQAKVDHEKCVRCGYCISACKDFYIKFITKREQ